MGEDFARPNAATVSQIEGPLAEAGTEKPEPHPIPLPKAPKSQAETTRGDRRLGNG